MKILIAYQPTAEGRRALEAARENARLRGGSLVLARHVKLAGETEVPGVGRSATPPKEARSGQDVAKLQQDLDSVAEDLRASGIETQPLLLTEGNDPAEAFLELAKEQGVELIVIGLRRRSPVGKLVLGSVSQDILLHADCPVLAVKGDEEH